LGAYRWVSKAGGVLVTETTQATGLDVLMRQVLAN